MSKIEGTMNLETEAGDIQVDQIRLDHDLTAKASAGAIRIRLSEAPKAAAVDLRSEVGKVTADLNKLDADRQSRNRLSGTIGKGGPRLEATTAAGAIFVAVN